MSEYNFAVFILILLLVESVLVTFIVIHAGGANFIVVVTTTFYFSLNYITIYTSAVFVVAYACPKARENSPLSQL